MTQRTTTEIAYDRAGPSGGCPLVLVHAGVADRRMWDPQWPALTAEHDTVRLDLRGYGDSKSRPGGALSPAGDVLETLSFLGVERCDLVGASFGAGVALEVALEAPSVVASLVLVAPGGSLVPAMTPGLRAFIDAENAAIEAGDLDAAVRANLDCWVQGHGRAEGEADPRVRAAVEVMQRRAFEVSAGWEDIEQEEMNPPALERLAEITAPTLMLLGDLDLDAIRDAGDRVSAGIAGARCTLWPGVAHLPSMERPELFLTLLQDWLAEQDPDR